MTSLVIVTPWPPQKTGIADNVYDIVAELIKHIPQITIVTNCQNPTLIEGVDFIYCDEKTSPDLSLYPNILYEIGNNVTFHKFMIPLIQKYRGVFHIHDLVLHHIIADLTFIHGTKELYLDTIGKWYGLEVKMLIKKLWLEEKKSPWDTPIVTDVPLFEELVQYAESCIVHSDFAKEKILAAFPQLQVEKIFQLYQNLTPSRTEPVSSSTCKKIGIFGGVDPQKNVDIAIQAFDLIWQKQKDIELHIVGELDQRCKNLIKYAQTLSSNQHIIFHGRVDLKVFHEIASKTDLCIALRYPTMGETSAVVMKFLQQGIPVIVNDIGWYKELPAFVDKVPIKNSKEYLYKTLEKYLQPKYFYKKKTQFIEYANQSLTFQSNIERLNKLLRKFFSLKTNQQLYLQTTKILSDLNLINNDYFLKNFVEKSLLLFED